MPYTHFARSCEFMEIICHIQYWSYFKFSILISILDISQSAAIPMNQSSAFRWMEIQLEVENNGNSTINHTH